MYCVDVKITEKLDISIQNSNSSYDGRTGVREHPLDGNVVLKLPISNSQGDPVSDKSKSVHVQKKGSNDFEDLSGRGNSSGFVKWLSVVKKINELESLDIQSVYKCSMIEEFRKKLSEK